MSSGEPTDTVKTGDRVAAARRAVEANPHWYHSIELAPGVVTPGQVDLRRIAARLLPESLNGQRALDVGTFDGFWAFELERRGADVVATDVERLESAEWPPVKRAELEERTRHWDIELGRGFRLAAEALGSGVRRMVADVYETSPDIVGGTVDFVFAGDILLHLRDPVRALERIYQTLAPGGTLMMFETFSIRATLQAPRRPMAEFRPLRNEFNWWHANLATLWAWPVAAGFSEVKRHGFYRPTGQNRDMREWRAAFVARR